MTEPLRYDLTNQLTCRCLLSNTGSGKRQSGRLSRPTKATSTCHYSFGWLESCTRSYTIAWTQETRLRLRLRLRLSLRLRLRLRLRPRPRLRPRLRLREMEKEMEMEREMERERERGVIHEIQGGGPSGREAPQQQTPRRVDDTGEDTTPPDAPALKNALA